jgi:hypothetical protein
MMRRRPHRWQRREKHGGTDMNYARDVIRLHHELEKNRYGIAQSLGISHATMTPILGLANVRGAEVLGAR